jgi:hypothetical protein
MRDKPENIRRLSISSEVKRALLKDDAQNGVTSFVSKAVPLGNRYVVIVLQLPERELAKYPNIQFRWNEEVSNRNLITLSLREILDQAAHELTSTWPEPGRSITNDDLLDADEIVDRAARRLMHTPFVETKGYIPGLFDPVDEVSKLMYEGATGAGRIILANPDDPNLHYVLRFSAPVRIGSTRWLRKLLEMATCKTALIADHEYVYGLGNVSDLSAPPFVVDIIGSHQWDLRRGETTFLRMRSGKPSLPKEPIFKERFEDNMRRLLANVSDADASRAHNIMDLMLGLGRGGLIVFADDAADEAERLDGQGTRITPTAITSELLERATCIDGAILADPRGVCYAIGVILDGMASPACTPSRGGRYNSALRYVGNEKRGRMALVFSEDRTLDVLPLLLPRISADELEHAVSELEAATKEDFHKARLFLDDHRFYLNAGQCERVNSALDRIESEPREVGEIVLSTERFSPHPAMNSDFLK